MSKNFSKSVLKTPKYIKKYHENTIFYDPSKFTKDNGRELHKIISIGDILYLKFKSIIKFVDTKSEQIKGICDKGMYYFVNNKKIHQFNVVNVNYNNDICISPISGIATQFHIKPCIHLLEIGVFKIPRIIINDDKRHEDLPVFWTAEHLEIGNKKLDKENRDNLFLFMAEQYGLEIKKEDLKC